MKIAIFGGTFDPVHVEHINLVKAAKRQLKADKIIVIPAFVPPHKQDKKMASPQDRLAMAKRAFDAIAGCEVSAYEINARRTSYTYLTLQYYKNKYPNDELFFLVGSDMLKDFYNWKNPEIILSLAELVVCNREGDKLNFALENLKFFARFKKKFRLIEYTGKNVSSTRARVLCAFGEDVKPYLPPDVIDYIEAHKLYRVEGVKEAFSYLKSSRKNHSVRLAVMACALPAVCRPDERKIILAASLHDIAKNMPDTAPELVGFTVKEDVPPPVVHQFAGAYVAEHTLGVTDEEVLSAVRGHTSGKPNMTLLEKVIFLADLLEPGREFSGIEKLRALFYTDLEACLLKSLKHQIKYLKKLKGEIYPLTLQAYRFLKEGKKI